MNCVPGGPIGPIKDGFISASCSVQQYYPHIKFISMNISIFYPCYSCYSLPRKTFPQISRIWSSPRLWFSPSIFVTITPGSPFSPFSPTIDSPYINVMTFGWQYDSIVPSNSIYKEENVALSNDYLELDWVLPQILFHHVLPSHRWYFDPVFQKRLNDNIIRASNLYIYTYLHLFRASQVVLVDTESDILDEVEPKLFEEWKSVWLLFAV